MRTLQPCGTEGAYRRHRKAGEQACRPCVDAHSDTCARQEGRTRPVRLTETERFWANVERDVPAGECWLWRRGTSKAGYAYFTTAQRVNRGAHRWAWELVIGPIADGLELDHLCNVRHCVNPSHLEPVTPAENKRRMVDRRRASRLEVAA